MYMSAYVCECVSGSNRVFIKMLFSISVYYEYTWVFIFSEIIVFICSFREKMFIL